jgi:hypothetical protein
MIRAASAVSQSSESYLTEAGHLPHRRLHVHDLEIVERPRGVPGDVHRTRPLVLEPVVAQARRDGTAVLVEEFPDVDARRPDVGEVAAGVERGNGAPSSADPTDDCLLEHMWSFN